MESQHLLSLDASGRFADLVTSLKAKDRCHSESRFTPYADEIILLAFVATLYLQDSCVSSIASLVGLNAPTDVKCR